MKILFVSHYFPPEVNAPASRTYEHARQWVADGHEVTVITCAPNHPRGKLFAGYRNRLVQEDEIRSIRVIRCWTYITPNEGFLKRTLNYVSFAVMSVLVCFKADRPDVVVATSPQFFAAIAGAIIARLRRRPFVLEVRDLWPDSIVQLGQLTNPAVIGLLERIETLLYRSAVGIVVNTRSFVDHIEACGADRNRIELIYNGIDTRLFHPRPRDHELLSRHGLANRWLVAYVGTLGLAHGLTTVLDAAAQLREDPEIMFLFIGDGADRARLESEATRRQLENVRFIGLLPRDELPAWIASIDCLLVMLRDLPVFETVIPSKIFEFCAQERPVVVAARGEIRRLVTEAKAGLVIDPEDATQLVTAIEAVRTNPGEAEVRANAGREWVERNFDRSALARQMLGFLERVAPPRT